MDAISQSVIAILCIVGVIYAIWLMCKCFQQKHPMVEQGGTFSRSARRAARIDRLLEFFGSATLLVVAGVLLVTSARGSLSNSEVQELPCLHRPASVKGIPPRKFSIDASLPGHPIVGADLSTLPITDDDVREVIRQAPDIWCLNLTDTNITDACLSELQFAPKLKVLSLGNTAITDSGLEHLSQVKGLDTLSLFGTPISGTGLEHLRDLTALQELNLQRTRITDESLRILQEFPQLKFLQVRCTEVTRAAALEFEAKRPGVICDVGF